MAADAGGSHSGGPGVALGGHALCADCAGWSTGAGFEGAADIVNPPFIAWSPAAPHKDNRGRGGGRDEDSEKSLGQQQG